MFVSEFSVSHTKASVPLVETHKTLLHLGYELDHFDAHHALDGLSEVFETKLGIDAKCCREWLRSDIRLSLVLVEGNVELHTSSWRNSHSIDTDIDLPIVCDHDSITLQPQLPHSGPLTSSTVPIGLLGRGWFEEPVPLAGGFLGLVGLVGLVGLLVKDVLDVFDEAHLDRVWYEFGVLRVLN